MRLPSILICCLLALTTLVARSSHAEAIDPAAARELLKQGYSLKKDGKYSEALERLIESLRLDSQIKTLINIADCEEQLALLTQAQKHWILARDQAALQGDQLLLGEAEKRLTALEARMPRLTINRTGSAVDGTEIRRGGVLLGGASLGVALPTDPGRHEVVVTAPGHLPGRYSVDLVEKDAKVLNVAPGPASASKTPASDQGPKAGEVTLGSPAPTRDAASAAGIWNTQRVFAVGAAGLGVVGFGVAAFAWSRAKGQHTEALSTCGATGCSTAAKQLQSDAVSNVHLTTGMLIAGSVLVAGGGVLWLTAPNPHASASVSFIPVASTSEAGIVAAGRF